jgi:hypothetical protein
MTTNSEARKRAERAWGQPEWHEPTFDDLLLETAEGMASVEANADLEWIEAAESIVRNLTVGTRFIGEQIVDLVNSRGFVTHDLRAMGPILQRLGRGGVIRKTGEYRAARTSHGSPKPIWQKRR